MIFRYLRVAQCCVVCLLVCLAWQAQAVVDDFTIRTFVGNDSTPPTTPIITALNPIAPTQINVTWSAATDDVQLGGYRLFRDAVQIATTTLLSFSDTGLTPSTTYSYYVDAFDIFNNVSSSSLTVATTTPPLPPPIATSTPTSTTPTGGTRILSMQNLVVTPDETSALFTWQTNSPSQYFLTWGRTTAYELGSVSGTVFSENHRTRIDMLEPGTVYYYKLTAIDSRGVTRTISVDSFTTRNKIFLDNVENVEGFMAEVRGNTVALRWRNTFTDPSYYVRVVRSHLFYPSNLQDGAVVYEGRGEEFTDSNALLARSPQYYTIFVIGAGGKVSSGAITRAQRSSVISVPGADPTIVPAVPSTTIPSTNINEGDEAILKASDIFIIQTDVVLTLINTITLDYQLPFIIRIPVEAVAKNLKTITVSLQNPSNQQEVSAYLLKLNPAGSAYEALIAPAHVVGASRILVEVFDYEKQTVRRISTQIEFTSMAPPVPFFPDQLAQYLMTVAPWLLLFLLLWLFFVLYTRRRYHTAQR